MSKNATLLLLLAAVGGGAIWWKRRKVAPAPVMTAPAPPKALEEPAGQAVAMQSSTLSGSVFRGNVFSTKRKRGMGSLG